jgi:hypothetical protein
MPTDPWAAFNPQPAPSSQMPQIGAPILTVPGADIKQTEAATAAAKSPSEIKLANAQADKATQDVRDAHQKAADQAKQERLRTASKILDTDSVLQAIKDAENNTGSWTTGLTGKLLAHIPSVLGAKNDAYDLQQELQTIGGNVAFDKYSSLKENMPQGAQGGIRLTENEINLLQKLQGSIAQGQDPATLKTNLDRIDQRYRTDAALAAGMDPADPHVMQTFGIKAPPKDSLQARTSAERPADIDAIMKKYGVRH